MINSKEVVQGSFKVLLQDMQNPECSDGSDYINDLEAFSRNKDLPQYMVDDLFEAAQEAGKLRAVVKLLMLVDGKLHSKKGFDAYLKLTANDVYEILDKEVYALMLKAGYAEGLQVLHSKLKYPTEFDSKNIRVLTLLAEFKFDEFIELLAKGEPLNGCECSFGFRFEKYLTGQNWQDLKKFHNVLRCHPAVLNSEKALGDLVRDENLVRSKTGVIEDKSAKIARIQKELFNKDPNNIVTHKYSTQAKTAKLDFSSDDEFDSCNSSGSSGSNIELSHDLLRSVMARNYQDTPRSKFAKNR